MVEETLPPNLPIPTDDGALAHLTPGTALPPIPLPSTSGSPITLSTLPGISIIFCYPRTALPHETIPADWDAIPGARGCTPQACAFRDAAHQLLRLGVAHVFGLSTQTSAHQRELKARLNLPYSLLSDEEAVFVGALGLPTFVYGGEKLVRRVTLVVDGGKVVWVHYPVFPPDESAKAVIEFLAERK